MKKLLFCFLLLGFGSLGSLHAVAPVPYTVTVMFSQKVQLSGAGAVLASFYTEGGVPTAYIDTNGESGIHLASLRPGKRYELNYYGDYTDDYWLGLTAPDGYAIYIDGSPMNLITLTGLGGASFNETVWVELRPVAGAGALELGAFSGIALGQSVTWELGLGQLDGERSAGRIVFKQADLTGSPVSRHHLYYAPPGNYGTVHIVNDWPGNPTLRQIKVPAGVLDLVDEINGYSIKVYTGAQATYNIVTNVYDFTGSPWKTVRVESPGTNQLKITETEGSASTVSHLSLTSGTVSSGAYVWTLQEGDAGTWLRTTTHTSTVPVTGTRTNVVVTRTGGAAGTIVGKTEYRLATKAWGEVLTQVIADPDTAALTTTYTYYETAPTLGFDAHRGNYTRVESVTYPTANWVAYEYYDDWNRRGQLKHQFQPYKDLPATAQLNTAQGRVLSYQYTTGWSGRHDRATSVEERVDNVLSGKSTLSHGDVIGMGWGREYATTNAFRDASNSQSSYFERYRGDAGWGMQLRPYDQRNPDGSRTVWSHVGGTFDYVNRTFGGLGGIPDVRTLIVRGSTSSAGADLRSALGSQNYPAIYLVPYKSTVEAVIRSGTSQLLRTETYVYGGSNNFFLVAYEDFYYNAQGRLIERIASNGARTEYGYANGRLDHTIGPDGTRTEFTYDGLGRVATQIKKGAAARAAVITGSYNYPAQGDITTTHTYDGLSRATQSVVSDGSLSQTTTRSYDLAGRPTQEVAFSGSGNSLTTGLAYSSGGRVVTTTMPGGATRVVEVHYDGLLKSVSGTGVVSENHAYWVDGGSGVRARQSVYGGNYSAWTNSAWDWLGRPIEEWTPRWDGNNWARMWHYNNQGQLWKHTQPGVAAMLFEYNTLGERIREGLDLNANDVLDIGGTDRITTSDVSFYAGAAWWLRTQVGTYATASSSAHTVLSTVYEQISGLSSNVLRNTHAYDFHDNVTVSYTHVDRANKTLQYITDTPDSNINSVLVTYNGLAAETRDTAGITHRTEYDGLGRVWKTLDPRKGTTTTAYIAGTNFVSTVTDPATVVQATYTYDSAGRVSSVKDALNKYAYTTYNNRGQVYRQWGDIMNPVEYAYNNLGQQTSMKTYRGGSGWTGSSWPGSPGTADTTTWNFHAATNLLSSKTDASSKSVSYTYTPAGQISRRTWARSTYTDYAYDSGTAELTTVDYSDSTTDLSYTYNRLGQTATVTDYTGTRTLTHNAAGQLTQEALGALLQSRNLSYPLAVSGVVGRVEGYTLSGASGSGTDLGVTYAYRTDGRLDTISSGKTFTYGYVANSHLVEAVTESTASFSSWRSYLGHRDIMQYNNTTAGVTTVSTFQQFFDNLGRVTYSDKSGSIFSRYSGGALVTAYGYNDRSEVTSETTYLGWSATVLTGRTDNYAYDNAGNRSSTTHNGDTATYTTNALNQYTQRTVPGIFDVAGAAGTGATVTVNGSSSGVTRHGEYFFKGHALTNTSNPVYTTLTVSDGTTSTNVPAFIAKTPEGYTYDDDGNLLSDGRWGYWYDAENRLYWMQTTTAAVSAGHPNVAYQFWYDYMGRRIRKLDYTWNGSGWATGTEWRFIYEGWNLIGEYSGAYSGGSFPTGSARHFLWGKDLSGTVHGAGGVGGLLMTKEAGESYLPAYDTMGNVHAMIRASDKAIVAAYEYDAFGRTIRESGAYAGSNPFRYSTKYTDETGLVYYGLRYYHPSMGRFINRDPIGERGGRNLYAFVGNNGVSRYDLLGLLSPPEGGWTGEEERLALDRWRRDNNLVLLPENDSTTYDDGYGGYVPASGDDFGFGYDGLTVLHNGIPTGGSMTSSQIFDIFAPIYSANEYAKYLAEEERAKKAASTNLFNSTIKAPSVYLGKKKEAPNSTGTVTGVVTSGGSALGNVLRKIPLVGGMLGGVGDMVAGVGNTALGIATFGQSGTFGRGMGQIGYGIGGTANILARDVAATVAGVAGTVYTTVRDVADVVTLGNVVSGGNPLKAVGNLVSNALIPDYGMFGGKSWGTTQGRTPGAALNSVDYNSYIHDRDLGNVPRANTAWVRNQWSPVPNGQVAPGAVGIAYVLAGTLPFLASDLFTKP